MADQIFNSFSPKFQYARSLELMGKIPESIKQYEEAGTIDFDLPRIALQTDDLNILFNYVL